jgi:hypothetical protein
MVGGVAADYTANGAISHQITLRIYKGISADCKDKEKRGR